MGKSRDFLECIERMEERKWEKLNQDFTFNTLIMPAQGEIKIYTTPEDIGDPGWVIDNGDAEEEIRKSIRTN